ncbi:MAG: VOC family protein [Candidatus Aenigmarchaeota archaeon]|nr:VOC family protein [Candidatus Aenigmarchaeota archaeon]
MRAKDGSAGFDFTGTYTKVILHKLIEYSITGWRKVSITFQSVGNGTKVTETFETENVYSDEQQRSGWQSILDNFKRYTESQSANAITPCLWFDDNAEEAAEFYTSIFKNSKVGNVARYDEEGARVSGRPKGSVMTIAFSIEGKEFVGLNGGPIFKFTPAISFFVNFDPSKDPKAKENLNALWSKLSQGGTPMMPLDKYPFSERYGWIKDKFGLTWQLILTKPEGDMRPKIVPSLLFVGDMYGNAEKAMRFYLSVFKESKLGNLFHYGQGQEPNKQGTVMFSDFMLNETWLAAMDGGGQHAFTFNEAISFMVYCDTQEEIDHYWKKLSAFPASEQCGWLKDKFGVSWQIVPRVLPELLGGDKKKSQSVMAALLKMKKLEINALKKAYERGN